MKAKDQPKSEQSPTIDRRSPRPPDESPMATLTRLPALRILERLPVPVVAVSPDGGVLFANAALSDLLGFTATQLTSMRFTDIFHTAEPAVSAVAVIRERANTLVHLSHAEGWTIRAVMSRSALQRADDQIALVTFNDLTEQLWADSR